MRTRVNGPENFSLDFAQLSPTMHLMDDQRMTVSASRIAAMLGLDRYCTPLTLFLRMRGQLSDEVDNAAIQQGRYYERATCDWACDTYGMEIVPGWEQTRLSHGYLSGHPDFVVRDEHGKLAIAEVKNPFWSYKGDDWGEPGTDEVPRAHFLQAMTYNHLVLKGVVTKGVRMDGPKDWADYSYVVAKLKGGIARYKIPYDGDIMRLVEMQAKAFVERVANNDPPSPEDEQDMRNLWPVQEGKVADCNSAFVEQLKALDAVKKQIKQLTEQESALKAVVLGFARDAETIEYVDNGSRTTVCSLATNRTLDTEALLADHPDLLAQFAKLDTAALRKANKALVERYMRRPADPTKATRVIRLKLPREAQ